MSGALPRSKLSTLREVEAVATQALTTITTADVATATCAAELSRPASAQTITGTVTKPPPNPNNTVVRPVTRPIPSKRRTLTDQAHQLPERPAIEDQRNIFDCRPV
jgi:hypothetical protein